MFIANFTPDTIEWMHIGVTGKINPDDILEFDDARGKHILNKWGQRGLLRVSYEDKGNEEPLKAQAYELYKRFCIRQISNFNQHNEALKNQNSPYVYPSKFVEEKAKEFGIELVGPWKLKQSDEVSKQKLESMESEISDLKNMLSQLLTKSEDVVKERDQALIDQFAELDKHDFRNWFESNMSKIRTWPESVQILVRVRWEETQGREMYPLTS